MCERCAMTGALIRTYADLVMWVQITIENYKKIRNPSLTMGAYLMNELGTADAEMRSKILGTDCDPTNDDSRLKAFFNKLPQLMGYSAPGIR